MVAVGGRVAGLIVVSAVLVVVVLASIVYLHGGDRLSGAGGNVTGPVTIGEEFHTMVLLDTRGGSVELVSARPTGVSNGLQVDVTLVRLGTRTPIGSSRGPLEPGFQEVTIPGHQLRSSDQDRPRYALDVRVIATAPGRYRMAATECPLPVQ